MVVKLMIDLPYPEWFKKGMMFNMDEETSNVYGYDKSGKCWNDYPLRSGLAGYLWMLRLNGDRFLKEIKD